MTLKFWNNRLPSHTPFQKFSLNGASSTTINAGLVAWTRNGTTTTMTTRRTRRRKRRTRTTTNYKGRHIVRYRLNPETSGNTLKSLKITNTGKHCA
jgi:hypothetical protein